MKMKNFLALGVAWLVIGGGATLGLIYLAVKVVKAAWATP